MYFLARLLFLLVLAVPMGILAGCSTSPRSTVKRNELSDADQSVRSLVMERVLEEQAQLKDAEKKSEMLAEEKAGHSNA